MKIDGEWKKVILSKCFNLGPQVLKSLVLKLFFMWNPSEIRGDWPLQFYFMILEYFLNELAIYSKNLS